jgi:putative DNA primase/helicase
MIQRDERGVDVTITPAKEVKPRRIDYLWRGRLARGKLTAIGGDPGVGKGTLGIDIAARISTGRAWPDGTPAPQGRVWLLTGEDDPADTIVPRLMVANADLDYIGLADSVETVYGERRRFDLSLDAEVLVERAALDGVVALIIDPLSSYLGKETNSWRDSDMRRVLDPLAEAAARHGVAVILVAHLTKASGNKALYRFQGSIATTAAARFGFLVANHPDDRELRVFAAVKTNLHRLPASLTFRVVAVHLDAIDDEVGCVQWVGSVALTADELLGPKEESRALDHAKEFLLAYAAGPTYSEIVKAAAKDAGIGTNTLWQAKGELGIKAHKDGIGRWMWDLPGANSDRDASNSSDTFEPSRSDRDASLRFNTNPSPFSGKPISLSIYGNHHEASYHHDNDAEQNQAPVEGDSLEDSEENWASLEQSLIGE